MSNTDPQVDEILLERKPSPVKLEVLGVYQWPIWRKEPSTFPGSTTSRRPVTCCAGGSS